MGLQPRLWLGLQPSRGLTGAGRILSQDGSLMAVGRRAQFLTPRACLLDSSSVFITWWLAFPRMGEPRGKGRSHRAFYNLVPKVTRRHFCLVLVPHGKSLEASPHSRGEELSSASYREEYRRIFGFKPLQLLFVGSSRHIKMLKPMFLTPHDTASLGRENCEPGWGAV